MNLWKKTLGLVLEFLQSLFVLKMLQACYKTQSKTLPVTNVWMHE